MLTHLTRSITPDAQTSLTGSNAPDIGKFSKKTKKQNLICFFFFLLSVPGALLSPKQKTKSKKAKMNEFDHISG